MHTGTYIYSSGTGERVSSRTPSLRPVDRDARDTAGVKRDILRGYRDLETRGKLDSRPGRYSATRIKAALA